MTRYDNPRTEGYIYLTVTERTQAEDWMGAHADEITGMDAGLQLGREQIVYGLQEDHVTGASMLPCRELIGSTGANLKHFRREAQKYADMLDRSILRLNLTRDTLSRLTPREYQVLDLWLDSISINRIALILKCQRQNIQQILDRASRKANIAIPKAKSR